MRFYETPELERIGYDFYCDVANRIVKARNDKGWTQKDLAEKSGVKLSKLSKIELVQTRVCLDDLEKLSRVLSVTINWLIEAEIDSQVGDCLYIIWTESVPDLKLYMRATSKRMAFLLFKRKIMNIGLRFESRERFFIKLVGVPVTDKEIKDKFKKRISDEDPIEPDL